MSDEALRVLEKTHSIIDFTPVDSGYRVRYLANEENKEAVSNTSLEDSYTYIIQRDQAS